MNRTWVEVQLTADLKAIACDNSAKLDHDSAWMQNIGTSMKEQPQVWILQGIKDIYGECGKSEMHGASEPVHTIIFQSGCIQIPMHWFAVN